MAPFLRLRTDHVQIRPIPRAAARSPDPIRTGGGAMCTIAVVAVHGAVAFAPAQVPAPWA